MVTRSHTKMVFRFSGMKRAAEFRGALLGLGLPAALGLTPGGSSWTIETDSRCLQFADKLTTFLYAVKGGR